jgi:hypothetical protein
MKYIIADMTRRIVWLVRAVSYNECSISLGSSSPLVFCGHNFVFDYLLGFPRCGPLYYNLQFIPINYSRFTYNTEVVHLFSLLPLIFSFGPILV